MKEGSFESQIRNLDFDVGFDIESHHSKIKEDEIRKIKTPDQVPDRIDLSQVPQNILRSSVIDSLIQQNEDLMTRLSVTLRRVATLEEKLIDAQAESTQAKTKYENVQDQVFILREQSRKITERLRIEEENKTKENLFQNEARNQIQVLEIRYAELYTSSQDRQARLEEKTTTLERAIRGYRKYRTKIKQLYIKLHSELKTLREKRQMQEDMISTLRQNLSETTEHITAQSREHKNNLATLTAAYETEVKSYKAEIEMLVEQNRVLGDRSSDYERVYNEKIKLENDIIIAERREDELRMQTSAELSNLQKTLARHRNDAKALSLELETKVSDLTAQTFLANDLAAQKSALSEQVDTLQMLWRDQQNHLEKVTEQKNSLQKLNQELSLTINEYRREIRDLKAKLDAEEQKAFEIKNTAQKIREQKLQKEDTTAPDIISKIDKALNDLHVGR